MPPLQSVVLQLPVLHSSCSSPYKGTGALEHSRLLQFCSSPQTRLEQLARRWQDGD